MEKVKIKTAVDSGKKTKDGNPMISIELEDGRKCTAYTADAINWTGEMELEIRPGQKINDVQYYNLFISQPRMKNQFPQRDYTFEKRNASLQRAIETAALTSKATNSKEILSVTEKYFQYLNAR